MKKNILLIFLLILSASIIGQNKYQDTTLIIKKHHFEIKLQALNTDYDQLMILRNGKIILTDSIDSHDLKDLKFVDFNGDTKCDIMLFFAADRVYNELYLFDKKRKSFKIVKQFGNFPEPTKLKTNPAFYYSYTNLGCEDDNWKSLLFKIEKFKAIPIAEINGEGCSGTLQNIYISKFNNGEFQNKTGILTLPYIYSIPQFSYKWTFIEKYWNEKYLNFK